MIIFLFLYFCIPFIVVFLPEYEISWLSPVCVFLPPHKHPAGAGEPPKPFLDQIDAQLGLYWSVDVDGAIPRPGAAKSARRVTLCLDRFLK